MARQIGLSRRAFQFGRTRGGVSRRADWAMGFTSTAFTNVPASSSVLLAQLAASVIGDIAPGTIVRTRGLINVHSDQNAASENIVGAFSIAVVTDTARSQGIASLSSPVSDVLSDRFFVLQPILQKINVATAVGFEPQMSTQYVIDSKAMRKFEADEDSIVLVAENSGGFGWDIGVYLRFLVKRA